jgi:hypothetical protein
MFVFKDKCHRIRRLLSERADGPLSTKAEKKVRTHLEKCRECREEFAFYQELKEVAANLHNVPPPQYLWERIAVGLDEHPWGEEEVRPSNPGWAPGWALNRKINFAGAVLSLILIAALSFSPEEISQESRAVYSSPVSQRNQATDLGYVSLYLMTNRDKFPAEVREHYLGHIEGLNKKIWTIKSALERYPQNKHIMAQLAMTYRQKIKLYEEMGLSHKGGGGTALSGNFSDNELLGGSCYE